MPPVAPSGSWQPVRQTVAADRNARTVATEAGTQRGARRGAQERGGRSERTRTRPAVVRTCPQIATASRNATGRTARGTGTRRQIVTGANPSGARERHGAPLPPCFRRCARTCPARQTVRRLSAPVRRSPRQTVARSERRTVAACCPVRLMANRPNPSPSGEIGTARRAVAAGLSAGTVGGMVAAIVRTLDRCRTRRRGLSEDRNAPNRCGGELLRKCYTEKRGATAIIRGAAVNCYASATQRTRRRTVARPRPNP